MNNKSQPKQIKFRQIPHYVYRYLDKPPPKKSFLNNQSNNNPLFQHSKIPKLSNQVTVYRHDSRSNSNTKVYQFMKSLSKPKSSLGKKTKNRTVNHHSKSSKKIQKDVRKALSGTSIYLKKEKQQIQKVLGIKTSCYLKLSMDTFPTDNQLPQDKFDLASRLKQSDFENKQKLCFKIIRYCCRKRIFKDKDIDQLYQYMINNFQGKEEIIKEALIEVISSLDL